MENYETLKSFEQGVEHFERLFRVKPEAIVHDLHPNYLATRYALQRAERENLPLVGVQHHHAHIAACMAENGLDGSHPVIGVAFDGTGYGDDGAIWGGEFLIADYKNYQTGHPFGIFSFAWRRCGHQTSCSHSVGIALVSWYWNGMKDSPALPNSSRRTGQPCSPNWNERSIRH